MFKPIPTLSKMAIAVIGAVMSSAGFTQAFNVNEDRVLAESDLVVPPFKREARSWLQCPPDAFRVDKKAYPGEDLSKEAISLESTNIERQGEDVLILSGDAEFIRGSQTVLADQLKYNQSEETMEADGNVLLIMENTRVTADQFSFDRGVQTGTVRGAQIHFPDNYNKNPNPQEVNIAGRATAEEINILNKNNFVLRNTEFTRCGEGDDSVKFTAPSVDVDTNTEMATAHHAVLRFKNVPVFYLPWVRVPITDRRQTGFLFPTFGGSNDNGFYTAIPYYLNLHPQVDATLTPYYYTKRGAAIGGEIRYLSESTEGGFQGNYIPNDNLENDESRHAYQFNHRTDVGPFYGLLNLRGVSDTDYFDDLEADFSVASSRTVAQNVEVGFSQSGSRIGVRTRTHDLVDDDGLIDEETGEIITDDTSNFKMPYDIRPEFFVEAEYDLFNTGAGRVITGLNGTLTQFDVDDESRPTGSRTFFQPYIEYSFEKPWGFITPKLSATNIRYSLDRLGDEGESLNGEGETSGTTLSVGSGLVLEKFIDFANKPAVMTLEPQMMYANTSADNADVQNSLPTFDTSDKSFTSYDSLFNDMRFVGGDRIGDENRVSLGVRSKIYDTEGFERVSVGIGQALYLDDREVNVNGETATSDRSPMLMEAKLAAEDKWSVSAFAARDTELGYFPNRRLSFGYSNDNFLDMSLGYYVNEDETKVTSESVNAALRLPISERFRLIGAVAHNLVEGENTLEGFGLEYENCCWGVSVDYRNRRIDQNEMRDRIMFRFRFKGLGEVRSGMSATGF